jgi:RNA polymerase sigma-70 factor, ECF subfamily
MSSDAVRTALRMPISVQRGSREVPEAASEQAARHSDEQLLALLQSGDEQALASLFDRYARLVLTIGFRILRDYAEAEDLLQEVFVHVHERCAQFDPAKGAGRSWIVQIAYCRAFDRRGYLARRGFYSGADLLAVQNTLKEEFSSEERIHARIAGEQLRRGFQELTEKQRATLELFFFEAYTFREIAERLGETLDNIRHHYYRGMERLNRTEAAKALRHRK